MEFISPSHETKKIMVNHDHISPGQLVITINVQGNLSYWASLFACFQVIALSPEIEHHFSGKVLCGFKKIKFSAIMNVSASLKGL